MLPVNTQLRTVGVAKLMYMPPPCVLAPMKTPDPPVMVNPSSTVVVGSPLSQRTAVVPVPVASIVVCSAPSELRTTIDLPSRSIASS